MAEVASHLHFETRIARCERHDDDDFEDRVVLSVSCVVAFQEASPHRRARSGKLGQVQVDKAQLLIRPSAFNFLRNSVKRKMSTSAFLFGFGTRSCANTLRTDIRRRHGSRTPVDALADILQTNGNLAPHRTVCCWTSSLSK